MQAKIFQLGDWLVDSETCTLTHDAAPKAVPVEPRAMDVLVALGTSAAYFYSLYLTLQWTMETVSSHHMPALYYETSAILITLILLGKLFETLAKGRTYDFQTCPEKTQRSRGALYRHNS